MFLIFVNFYWQFIQGLSQIATLLILILQTTIVDQNFDNNSKHITEYEVDVEKKRLSKRNKTLIEQVLIFLILKYLLSN